MSEEVTPGVTPPTEVLSYLKELVGPGKKFATIEDLAKGKLEADNFIEVLKKEKDELLRGVEKAKSVRELMELMQTNQPKEGTPVSAPQNPEELQAIVEKALEQRDAKQTAQANRSKAKELVLPLVNGDADQVAIYVESKAAALGISADDIWSLSEKSPNAFAELVGATPTKGSPTTNTLPKVNNESNPNLPVLEINGFKTKAWFDAQRKSMGNQAFIRNAQMQRDMIASRSALGEKFYA